MGWGGQGKEGQCESPAQTFLLCATGAEWPWDTGRMHRLSRSCLSALVEAGTACLIPDLALSRQGPANAALWPLLSPALKKWSLSSYSCQKPLPLPPTTPYPIRMPPYSTRNALEGRVVKIVPFVRAAGLTPTAKLIPQDSLIQSPLDRTRRGSANHSVEWGPFLRGPPNPTMVQCPFWQWFPLRTPLLAKHPHIRGFHWDTGSVRFQVLTHSVLGLYRYQSRELSCVPARTWCPPLACITAEPVPFPILPEVLRSWVLLLVTLGDQGGYLFPSVISSLSQWNF